MEMMIMTMDKDFCSVDDNSVVREMTAILLNLSEQQSFEILQPTRNLAIDAFEI